MSVAIKRRDFVALVGGAAAGWPLAAFAQGPQKVRGVGVLLGYPEGDEEALLRLATMKAVLEKLGWTDGRDLRFDVRFAGNTAEKLRDDAQSLVKLAPDVLVVQGNRPLTILNKVTRTIPIVFAQVADPVGGGLIANLARPGGNATGFTNFEASMGGKWLEALKDVVPSLRRAVVLYHPDTAANIAYWKAAEAAAPSLGVTVTPAGVRNSAEIERALAAAGADCGVVAMPHDVTASNRDLIIALAAKHRMPAVFAYRFFVTQGGLVYYGFNYVEQWGQVAGYVHRILRGEKPADLPVQAPTKFELAINLKTAKSLGLDIPATVLARADEVIE